MAMFRNLPGAVGEDGGKHGGWRNAACVIRTMGSQPAVVLSLFRYVSSDQKGDRTLFSPAELFCHPVELPAGGPFSWAPCL